MCNLKAGGLPSMRAETTDRCEESRLQLLGKIQKDLRETQANTQEIMLALNITPPPTTTPVTTPTTCPNQPPTVGQTCSHLFRNLDCLYDQDLDNDQDRDCCGRCVQKFSCLSDNSTSGYRLWQKSMSCPAKCCGSQGERQIHV